MNIGFKFFLKIRERFGRIGRFCNFWEGLWWAGGLGELGSFFHFCSFWVGRGIWVCFFVFGGGVRSACVPRRTAARLGLDGGAADRCKAHGIPHQSPAHSTQKKPAVVHQLPLRPRPGHAVLPPKRQAGKKKQRARTQDLPQRPRAEPWGEGLRHFRGFPSPGHPDMKPQKLQHSLLQALLYASR